MTIDRLSLPPLKAVRMFEAAARYLSFVRAAEELFVTPNAVGQQVRQLESHLGQKLFTRRGGALALTKAGDAYAREVRPALHQISRATGVLMSTQRTLTIWAPPTLASRWLLPRLGIFHAMRGDIDIRVCAEIAEPDPARLDIDLVIEHSENPGTPGALTLFEEEVYPVCSPALLARLPQPLTAQALRSMTLLHTSLHDFWETWLQAEGVDTGGMRRTPFFNQAMLALDAAAAGQGVALACDALIARELREGRLVPPFGRRLRTGWAYRLAAPQGRLSAQELQAMRDVLLSTPSG
ncbi:MAG: LysR family transcriptional regulator [Proteobacteria bacterium]|nr:LysR family transcriptional regulator [Pseudomonadota bacterium]